MGGMYIAAVVCFVQYMHGPLWLLLSNALFHIRYFTLLPMFRYTGLVNRVFNFVQESDNYLANVINKTSLPPNVG